VRVHGIHLQVGISSGGPALIDALIVLSWAATRSTRYYLFGYVDRSQVVQGALLH